jgi:ABC-2 type transport system permease protein
MNADPAPKGRSRTLARVQFTAVVRKEALQTLRDRRVMFLLIIAPLLQTVLFGFAVDFDVDRVPTAVVDLDGSETSRMQVQALLADGTLRRAAIATSAHSADAMLDHDEIAAAVLLPPRFGADVAAGRTARVQLLLDGTDPNRSGTVASAGARYFAGRSVPPPASMALLGGLPSVNLVPRVFFNPSLKTAIYVVPGILAMLLVIVTTITTAMGLSREREAGTLEQVMVTPIQPFLLLAGKMMPYVAIGLFDTLLVLTAIAFVFDVPVRGPLWVLGLGTLFYLFSTLGVGLFVSTISSTQQQSFLGGFLFVLPFALLSGIMTPIRAMPGWLQVVTWVNPLRFFSELVRGVLLRGAGMSDLWRQVLILFIYGFTILMLATLRFRRRLA